MEPITPHGFPNPGGREKPVDERDVKLGALAPKVYTYPPSKMHPTAWSVPVEYQAQQPACGAHAGAKLIDLYKSLHSTPRFTWHDIKTFDGLAIADGTDIRSIFKSLKGTGSLDFPLMGNDASLDLNTYAHPAITTAMSLNAGTRKAPGYGFGDDLSFNGLKQYINDHGAVILLVLVGAEWWTKTSGENSWNEADILPLRPPAPSVSGHFIVAHSYDENYIYFINSWSDTWGRKGHGYFGANYAHYVLDAGTLISLAFTQDLQLGMTDPDVQALQVILNKNPQTQIASTGAGSPGLETTYFGQLTLAAVKKFQALNNIPATGYVGPLTRAVLNKS